MTDITILHNPARGTSRSTLAIIAQMGAPVRAVLRDKAAPCAELKLNDPKWTDDELPDFMMAHPILINRPIVQTPLGTRLCRPSEAVLELLPVPRLAGFTKQDGENVVDSGARRV